MSAICDTCAKPLPDEAIARQQEQMKPREPKEGYAILARNEAFLPLFDQPMADVRVGDIIRITLISGAVEDITAGFYCECDEDENPHYGPGNPDYDRDLERERTRG